MARHAHGRILLFVTALAAVGCSSAIRYPKLRGPGPAKYQRANAEAFDPYPLPDLGPPIDGGRPREFGIPRNEVERAQDFSIVQAARRNMPLPGTGVAVAPPVAIGAPPPISSTAPPFTPMTPPPAYNPAIPTAPTYQPTAPIYTPTAPPTATPSAPFNQPSVRY